MLVNLSEAHPEQVAQEFIGDCPTAVTVGADKRRTKRYWRWQAPLYRSISEDGFQAIFTRWLVANYANLRRSEVEHIRGLIVAMRYIGPPVRQWIVPPQGIAVGWHARDCIATPAGIVHLGRAIASNYDCCIPPTPDYFAWRLDTNAICEEGGVESFVDRMAAEFHAGELSEFARFFSACETQS